MIWSLAEVKGKGYLQGIPSLGILPTTRNPQLATRNPQLATRNMKLPKIAINNAQFVIIMVLIAVVIGTQALERMPRSEDPQVDFPFFVVTAIYPGTSPEDMENLIADPIEEVLDEIDDLEGINTVIGAVSYTHLTLPTKRIV